MANLIAGTALVTGGGSGIGRAIAMALAAQGAAISVVDLLPEGGNQTVVDIEGAGGRATFIQADVSREDEVEQAVTRAVQTLGPLGILVNAAGILDGYVSVEDTDLDLWQRVLSINLTGTFLFCRRALKELLPAGNGRIINMASAAGLVGDGGGAAYIVSKHGVVGLTRQMGVKYVGRGVTVNAICPGPIETGLRANSTRILGETAPDMANVGLGGDMDLLRRVVPAGRRGAPEEVANIATFLAGDATGFITGQTFVIDGGWTAR